jgi:hypothetical protein
MDEMIRVQSECLDCVQELVDELIRPLEELAVIRPFVPTMSPIRALTALPGDSFCLTSVSNLESISSLRPVCSKKAAAKAIEAFSSS